LLYFVSMRTQPRPSLCPYTTLFRSPGYFATTQTAPIRTDGHPFNEFIISRTPAGRWGDPEDLAGTAVFLSSAASNFVNGQIIYRSEEHTSELQSRENIVCSLLLEKK